MAFQDIGAIFSPYKLALQLKLSESADSKHNQTKWNMLNMLNIPMDQGNLDTTCGATGLIFLVCQIEQTCLNSCMQYQLKAFMLKVRNKTRIRKH